MKAIKVNLKKNVDHSYPIVVHKGLFQEIPEVLLSRKYASRYAVIADSNVAKIYGKSLVSLLKKKKLQAGLISFPAGEKYKTLQTVEKILQQMLKAGIDRSGAVIGLGGGVTGDMAGFVASIYMRGLGLIHVPTTLLAMVDSGIGGKTGADLPSGKNLAGTFYQPKQVLIDPTLLTTLSQKQIENGMAEVIKYGILGDEELLRWAETESANILAKDPKILQKIIISCSKMKAAIVSEDERENGRRVILNYGHTLGHAFEKLTRYKIGHGEAIAMGMFLINFLAVESGILDQKLHTRIEHIFQKYNLLKPLKKIITIPQLTQKLWKIMQHDKKNKDGKIRFIVAKGIGDIVLSDSIRAQDFSKILKTLKNFL